MAKLVNAHKRMAMGDKKSELYERAYKHGGSVCACRKGGSVPCDCTDCKMKRSMKKK